MFLLDTNICIYIIKKQPAKVIEKITSFSPEEICTSSVVVSELMYGARKSAQVERNLNALGQFFSALNILSYAFKQAEIYGQMRADLEKKGQTIGPYDLMIAAHAMSIRATLVTNNMKEFKRVKGLKAENWTV